MGIIDIINKVAKISCINILTYFVFIKLINYKGNNRTKILYIIVAGILESIIGITLTEFTSNLSPILICYFFNSIVIARITDNKLRHSVIVTFVSLTITYLIYLISILLSGIVLKLIYPNIELSNIIILVLSIIIEYIILNVLFKIKRLKNGVAFLQNDNTVRNIGIVSVAFIGVAVIVYALLSNSMGRKFNTYIVIGIIIELICMFIWIRKKITKHYKQNLKEKTIKELEETIKDRDKQIDKILNENKEIASINHKYSSRISALEKFSAKFLTKPEILEKMKTEFGSEFEDMQEQIKRLSEEYSAEMREKVKHKTNLERTGIFGIDNILDYMCNEAEKKNIEFNLKINGSINYMVENIINQSKLETLLGDHIKDAIIAIEHSNNSYKSILTIIGIIDDAYEVCILDTGIEFEIDTLLKLGTECITTHKQTGGSGIGFMTTFETLKETKASLIIEEKHPITNKDYTKAVRIRFDGKEEYKIRSYRAEGIRQKADTQRIIIESLTK